MGFTSGSTTMDALVDHIAAQLIATGDWADADSVGLPSGATPAKRVVKHVADTGTDSGFYLVIRRAVSRHTSQSNYWNEIRVDVASNYDSKVKEPTGNFDTTGIPTEHKGTDSTANNKSGSFYMWTDVTGFAIMTTWNAGSTRDMASFLCVERIVSASREYNDGHSNFFVTAWASEDYSQNDGSSRQMYYFGETTNGSNNRYDLNRFKYWRPFGGIRHSGTNTSSIPGIKTFRPAFKSIGNNKVYLQFPLYQGNLDPTQPAPLAASLLWFTAAANTNLADGDLIEVGVKQYVYKAITSADTTTHLGVAIRYS